MSGLPTALNAEIGFQPPPILSRALVPVIDTNEAIYNPIIILLVGYLETAQPGALQDAVLEARRQIPDFMDKLRIRDARSFLVFANDLLKWIPHESFEGGDIYDVLCMFYFVFRQASLLGLQSRIDPTEVGHPLTWLSSWVVVYAQLIGLFMDSPASITEASLETFKTSPKYCFEEALIPHSGFRTFNQFFTRHLKPGMRPIDSPDDDCTIVYPADCFYDNSIPNQSLASINDEGVVFIKKLPWTISSLLQGSAYSHTFCGGVWMHAFLNAFNYHRQHAPVSGRVIEAKNIQGAAYFEVDVEARPTRIMTGLHASNTPGYQFLQTRGVIIIDNPKLGKVAVLPIGMALISSVELRIKKGGFVKKGDEISTLAFGGSDIICVFQAKAGLRPTDFVASPENSYSKMGTVLARTSMKT